ncbi:MAG: hypothetical protein ACRED8_09450, partial [Caulobacteraceae bacterium]
MSSAAIDLRRARRGLLIEIALAGLVAAGVWFAIDLAMSPITGMASAAARLVFAGKCLSLIVLFTFVTGVEAV